MADLTFIEKTKLEKMLDMGGGYVLDFSNRTLAGFVAESTGRDIYDAKYNYASGSKANRLRAFWATEPNHVVGTLISDLLDYCQSTATKAEPDPLSADCQRIAARLLQSAPVEALEAITPEGSERGFEVLAKSDSMPNAAGGSLRLYSLNGLTIVSADDAVRAYSVKVSVIR